MPIRSTLDTRAMIAVVIRLCAWWAGSTAECWSGSDSGSGSRNMPGLEVAMMRQSRWPARARVGEQQRGVVSEFAAAERSASSIAAAQQHAQNARSTAAGIRYNNLQAQAGRRRAGCGGAASLPSSDQYCGRGPPAPAGQAA